MVGRLNVDVGIYTTTGVGIGIHSSKALKQSAWTNARSFYDADAVTAF